MTLRPIAALTLAFAMSLVPGARGQAQSSTSTVRTPPFEAAASLAPSTFFPVSTWYSGGKARAPMLSAMTPGSEQEWREDIRKIRELGFKPIGLLNLARLWRRQKRLMAAYPAND